MGFGGGFDIPTKRDLDRRDVQGYNTTLTMGTLTDNPPFTKVRAYCFAQPVSHLDPSAPKTQFCQRYWINADHYKPGGPIFLFDTGESSGDKL